jgi:hypothetical protein
MGVNLVYGAFRLSHQPEVLLESLIDGLSRERVELDMVKFTGPDFLGVDNRLLSLWLVKQGMANAALFTPQGDVIQPVEALYKRPILVERGSFRPVTQVAIDMLQAAQDRFIQDAHEGAESPVVLLEITMKNLLHTSDHDPQDFLARVDCLGALGKTVLVSNFGEYYRLAGYLFRCTKKPIGIAMGIPGLREVFDEKYYVDLDGGILESFGRLFKNALKFYVYPALDRQSGQIITARNLPVAPRLRHLYCHLLENGCIADLHSPRAQYPSYSTREVLEKMISGDPQWESIVPPPAARIIKERNLFGARAIRG